MFWLWETQDFERKMSNEKQRPGVSAKTAEKTFPAAAPYCTFFVNFQEIFSFS
jgi:hypothetical protein